jgi:hypothetical protein
MKELHSKIDQRHYSPEHGKVIDRVGFQRQTNVLVKTGAFSPDLSPHTNVIDVECFYTSKQNRKRGKITQSR